MTLLTFQSSATETTRCMRSSKKNGYFHSNDTERQCDSSDTVEPSEFNTCSVVIHLILTSY